MRIGLLETGKVNPALVERHGTYRDMFARFLRDADPDFELVLWDVVDAGDIPASPDEAEGWLITGSKHGVYDGLPWIAPLKAFLRDAHAAGAPIVGICFGHQILAEALGGRAEKSERGWGCGLHRYRLHDDPARISAPTDSIALHAMHQDQVTAPPPGARVIASTDFCPYAGLAYGDSAISVQPHPEFMRDYEADLIRLRRGGSGIPERIAEAGLQSLEGNADNAVVGRWITDFFRRAAVRRKAA